MANMFPGGIEVVTASMTIDKNDDGKCLLADGTGALTFTLPSNLDNPTVVHFVNKVDQNMVIAGTANTLITFNDVAATSITYSTSSQKVGAAACAIWDGTEWTVFNESPNTATVA